ncbi:uncharacterized protein LOC131691172 [Topomyia yanbarensis]|uniref:uncharacterized protein LOC131691172 n=1 Tax=Topomyia yanbarensis TaxID=2498891 RepID=UPI00273B8091|nr:uncharacterized protein LOC131691172 [Topomyia yanbarensis]
MNNSEMFEDYFDSSDDECYELMFAQQLLSCVHTTAVATGVKSRGSRPGKRPNMNRFAEEGALRLYDYFAEVPVYTNEQFQRRFRMRRCLFLRISKALERNEYFIQKPDATGKLGLTNLQKCTAAIRQLAYGSPSDATDEYVRMGESTARKCLREFCRTVDSIFGETYLRSPTHEDVRRLLRFGQERGFPGMLGSLDCTHWIWKNCPTAWAALC